ncbi:hypothetical protein [Thiocystis violacea]|uniref:hypothetical protein n=1 Tax=Thiocystis violacea TaxID=13725 RepID=UPI001906FCA7|nr:hypothetical protein [Thiocystis violacea]MBK1717536.1 hypothetical protein [Thiocystis violacea]
MSNGFVLVLLRELREGLQKFRQDSTERMDGSNERLEQAIGSLARIENDLNELRKYMRQIALNQAKHEEFQSTNVENLDKELRDIKEQLRRLKPMR